jgi:hypothetical protein
MDNTEISAEKIAAFKNTNYIVISDDVEFTLMVDEFSEALSVLYKKTNNIYGAFITAYNPLAALQDSATNEAANKRLSDHLKALVPNVFRGIGADPKGVWPPEPSFFALGLDLRAAKLIGQRFRQDAIIWIDQDAIPQLILLR